jgi:hypothetical protein
MNTTKIRVMTAVITFKNSRKEYYQVVKEFNDIRHLENYIAKVDGKQGVKYINYEIK